MIALIYNWWTLFVRLANLDTQLEVITSRLLLLHSVGKQSSHAGQKKLTITSTHAKSKTVTIVLSAIARFLKFVKENTEQLSVTEILRQVLMVAFRKFLPVSATEPPKWLAWCKEVEHENIVPFKQFVNTIKAHWSGIVNFCEAEINNGILEGINNKIQLAKRRARGYRCVKNLINMIYLLCCKLQFDYPLYSS